MPINIPYKALPPLVFIITTVAFLVSNIAAICNATSISRSIDKPMFRALGNADMRIAKHKRDSKLYKINIIFILAQTMANGALFNEGISFKITKTSKATMIGLVCLGMTGVIGMLVINHCIGKPIVVAEEDESVFSEKELTPESDTGYQM